MLKVTDVEYMGDYSLLCWFTELSFGQTEQTLRQSIF